MLLPEGYEGLLLFKLPAISDELRAAILQTLEKQLATPVVFGKEDSHVQVSFNPDHTTEDPPDPPIPCRLVRLMLDPPPYDLGGVGSFSATVRGEEMIQHVVRCESCADWDCAGRPFHFDMAWQVDRDIFCRIHQQVFQHGREWPLSLSATRQHTEHCIQCAKWLEAYEASQSCEETRKRLHLLASENEYWYDESRLFTNHLQSCIPCKAWAFTELTCAEVRANIQRIYFHNVDEYKRFEYIGPVVEAHLTLCPACRAFGSDKERFGNPGGQIHMPKDCLDPDQVLFQGDDTVDK